MAVEKNRDIVDAEPSNGNVWKMLLGSINASFDDVPFASSSAMVAGGIWWLHIHHIFFQFFAIIKTRVLELPFAFKTFELTCIYWYPALLAARIAVHNYSRSTSFIFSQEQKKLARRIKKRGIRTIMHCMEIHLLWYCVEAGRPSQSIKAWCFIFKDLSCKYFLKWSTRNGKI